MNVTDDRIQRDIKYMCKRKSGKWKPIIISRFLLSPTDRKNERRASVCYSDRLFISSKVE